jgi:ABC-type uncharacterized transport system permease subunit
MNLRGGRVPPGAAAAVAFMACMAITALLLTAAGTDVTRAATALLTGAFGSWYAIGSGTLVRATPLILTGLAVAVAFRAGVFNIGAEGQFLIGAAAAAAVALRLSHLGPYVLVPLVLAGGVTAGACWAGIAAVLRVRYRVLEVISTIMLNFVAAYTVSYLVRGPLQERTHIYPQTPTFVLAAQLPKLASGTRLHLGFVIAVCACALVWCGMRFTATARNR